jgi:hypothetical protein
MALLSTSVCKIRINQTLNSVTKTRQRDVMTEKYRTDLPFAYAILHGRSNPGYCAVRDTSTGRSKHVRAI